MTQFSQTQIMQENLQKIRKNQNYFSCFINNLTQKQQPTNPFKKRLFDKNLRRSTVSCGHYNNLENYRSKGHDDEYDRQIRSSRLVDNESSNNQQSNLPFSHHHHNISQLLPHSHSNKITLTRSRHTNPYKNKISTIINNFRLQLDYLQQKLHEKVQNTCLVQQQFSSLREGQEKNVQKIKQKRQISFMIQNLDKIISFMIENCLNLEENIVIEGGQNRRNRMGNHKTSCIEQEEDESQQNNEVTIKNSFDITKTNRKNKFQKGYNMQHQNSKQMDKKKKKIVNMIQKQSVLIYDKQNQVPNIYFVNDQIHQHQKSNDNINASKAFRNRVASNSRTKYNNESHNKQVTNSNLPQQSKIKYISSQKQSRNYSSVIVESSNAPKSIYQTVLQERQMKIKKKKKMV